MMVYDKDTKDWRRSTWSEHREHYLKQTWDDVPEAAPRVRRYILANALEAHHCWPRVLKGEMTQDRFNDRIERMVAFLAARNIYEPNQLDKT